MTFNNFDLTKNGKLELPTKQTLNLTYYHHLDDCSICFFLVFKASNRYSLKQFPHPISKWIFIRDKHLSKTSIFTLKLKLRIIFFKEYTNHSAYMPQTKQPSEGCFMRALQTVYPPQNYQ